MPTEECLNWSGSISFPALTTTSHAVTAVLAGTLSNCSFDGTPQSFGGTVFGTLTGTATKTAASLSAARRGARLPAAVSAPARRGDDRHVRDHRMGGLRA